MTELCGGGTHLRVASTHTRYNLRINAQTFKGDADEHRRQDDNR